MKKHRSPNYPYIGLSDSLEKARIVQQEGRAFFVPFAALKKAWDYKSDGTTHSVIAALKAFGLVEVQGEGEKREVKVSDVGRKLLEENHSQREGLLKEAALRPKLHRELWDRYQGDLPSDRVLAEYLKDERSFNPASVNDFMAQFRDTISFANLSISDKIHEDGNGNNDVGDKNTDDTSEKFKPRRQRKEGEIVEELNFKLAPDSNVSLVFTSKQKVTQEDFNLLMKMLELQKMAFPTAKDVEKDLASAEINKRIVPEV